MNKLLPCPFCGGEAEFERMGTPRQSCIVACTDCGGRLETSEAGAACGSQWNDRHVPDGWQVVPAPGTTGEMDDAVRGLLILLSGGTPLTYERARRHVEMYHGPKALESWPDYALEGAGHIPKAAQADLLYRMLIAAAPKPGGEE